jgi:hypothetical protein
MTSSLLYGNSDGYDREQAEELPQLACSKEEDGVMSSFQANIHRYHGQQA